MRVRAVIHGSRMMLATTRFTQALLDLEDDEADVLFETLPGSSVPLWPQVRMNLALALSETELASVDVRRTSSLAGAVVRAARSFVPSRWDAARVRSPHQIAFLTGGVTTAATPQGMHNWLIGDYAEAFRDEAVILQWPAIRPRSGRPAFAMTRTLDPLRARAEVRTRLRPPPQNDRLIRLLLTEFTRRLGGGVRADQLESITASAIYAARVSASFEGEFDGILDRLRPRVVLFDSPVDGGWGALIAAMKARAIHVAEPQHGWIGPGHGAYNFGAAMHRPELSVELPDELLTFGEYWNDGLRYAGSVTTIGKPQFEQAVGTAPPLAERPREVLVVSSVGEPEKTSGFVLALTEALPRTWKVRFRPHPSERATCSERYPRLARAQRVTIDQRDDVYEALASSRIVVGVASTVLFEAAGFGCRVFVRDTPYVPFIVGDLFGEPLRDSDGIDRVIASAASDGLDAEEAVPDLQALWAPNALDNFRRWVQNAVAVPQYQPKPGLEPG